MKIAIIGVMVAIIVLGFYRNGKEWKRKYKSIKAELLSKNEKLSDNEEIIKEIAKDNEKYSDKIKSLKKTLDLKIEDISNLELKIKELNLTIESLENENKEIHDLNSELFKKNQELKSDRYLVRKVKGTKATKEDIKTMGIRRGAAKSGARKELKKKSEEEGK